MTATFALSAFGDEIAKDFEEQLNVLTALNIYGLDLRQAWGTNVLKLSNDEVQRVKSLCADAGVKVACIGSPLGKSSLSDLIETELANLDRILDVCDRLDCQRIRIFSFYPSDISTNAHYDQYVDETIERLTRMTERAQSRGITLLHENEKEIIGDTVDRCHALLSGVNNPHFRGIWDPANFVQVGEADLFPRGWQALGKWTSYIHIKDAHLSDGRVCPAGEGDGQVRELLDVLVVQDYQGVLALEPHLKVAGHSGGHSGADGMKIAVTALRKLMSEVGCTEVRYK